MASRGIPFIRRDRSAAEWSERFIYFAESEAKVYLARGLYFSKAAACRSGRTNRADSTRTSQRSGRSAALPDRWFVGRGESCAKLPSGGVAVHPLHRGPISSQHLPCIWPSAMEINFLRRRRPGARDHDADPSIRGLSENAGNRGTNIPVRFSGTAEHQLKMSLPVAGAVWSLPGGSIEETCDYQSSDRQSGSQHDKNRHLGHAAHRNPPRKGISLDADSKHWVINPSYLTNQLRQ